MQMVSNCGIEKKQPVAQRSVTAGFPRGNWGSQALQLRSTFPSVLFWYGGKSVLHEDLLSREARLECPYLLLQQTPPMGLLPCPTRNKGSKYNGE